MLLGIEASQGLVQKIFFVHVPAAFTMYVTLIMSAVAAAMYLIEKKVAYDHFSKAAMLSAFVFALCVMITGPVWAKPIWGTYWTWDPRLTTTLIVFLLICATLAVRHSFDRHPSRQAAGRKLGAILAIVAVLDIPLIHFSVKLWRGIHPTVIKSEGGLSPEFRSSLLWMSLSMIALGIVLTIVFFKIESLRDRLKIMTQKHLFEKGMR